jgi:hypothetical protein
MGGRRTTEPRRSIESNRKPGPIIEAACWAHARRKFFDLARINKAPIATEAVQRIDALFAIEREVNGVTPQERVAAGGQLHLHSHRDRQAQQC